jgi:polysaccharide export outer membrane protein
MMKVNLFLILLIVSLFASPVSSSERYFLNAGDQLNISVWNEDALQKDVIVLPDGMISFPLAGELLAKGKTVTELQSALTEKLTEFLANPVVTVSVTSVTGNTIHIMGKVLSPGPIVMAQNLDVMQALSLAGGLSPYAEEDDIIVLRRVEGKQTVIPVDFTVLKRGKRLDENVLLKSGDLIIIP